VSLFAIKKFFAKPWAAAIELGGLSWTEELRPDDDNEPDRRVHSESDAQYLNSHLILPGLVCRYLNLRPIDRYFQQGRATSAPP
jgi:hypothetical protein